MDRIEKDIGEGDEVPMLHTMRMESEVTSADIYLKHPGDEEDDQVCLSPASEASREVANLT